MPPIALQLLKWALIGLGYALALHLLILFFNHLTNHAEQGQAAKVNHAEQATAALTAKAAKEWSAAFPLTPQQPPIKQPPFEGAP